MTSPNSLGSSRATTAGGPVARAADRLIAAETSRVPCAPVRDEIGRDDVDAAYAVQQVLHRRARDAGREVFGRKIGLTSPAVQAQLGVDQPDFGVLFTDMDVTRDAAGAGVDTTRLLQPRIEAEVAFVLATDLDAPGPDGAFDAATVVRAVDAVVPALEIVDCRIADWDISFGDTVADNASAGLYVLGQAHVGPGVLGPTSPHPAELAMTMTRRHGDGEPNRSPRGTARTASAAP